MIYVYIYIYIYIHTYDTCIDRYADVYITPPLPRTPAAVAGPSPK